MKGRFFAITGLSEFELSCDSVELRLDNGDKFELCFRRAENQVAIYTDGRMTVHPCAANKIALSVLHD